jgi:hypothetical protein
MPFRSADSGLIMQITFDILCNAWRVEEGKTLHQLAKMKSGV